MPPTVRNIYAHRASALWEPLTRLVFPDRCPICRDITDFSALPWCEGCAPRVRLWDRPLCPSCRRFLPFVSAACPVMHDSDGPDNLYCLGAYDRALGPVVRTLKFGGARRLARPIGQLLAQRIDINQGMQLVLAVPTTPRTMHERGFGHAEEIARAVAQSLSLPFDSDCLYWRRKIHHQARLSAEERLINLHEALGVRSPIPDAIDHVLTVDDVMTTGATMLEATRALKAVGIQAVSAAIVALNTNVQ